MHSADDIHAMTLANLNGEFARIVSAAEAIATLKSEGAADLSLAAME
jgi:hypothetical protein